MVRTPDLVRNVNWPYIPPSRRIRPIRRQALATACAARGCPVAWSRARRRRHRTARPARAVPGAAEPKAAAAEAAPGDVAELRMAFSWAACPVGAAAPAEAALLVRTGAELPVRPLATTAPPPKSRAASAMPAPQRSDRRCLGALGTEPPFPGKPGPSGKPGPPGKPCSPGPFGPPGPAGKP